MDLPLKSRQSNRSRSAKSKEGEDDEDKPAVEHLILNPAKIQRFIYDYVLEKLKTEKLLIQVDPYFQHFLKNLPVPLELGSMRTMKEPNYIKFRNLIREKAGGVVLNMIRDN